MRFFWTICADLTTDEVYRCVHLVNNDPQVNRTFCGKPGPLSDDSEHCGSLEQAVATGLPTCPDCLKHAKCYLFSWMEDELVVISLAAALAERGLNELRDSREVAIIRHEVERIKRARGVLGQLKEILAHPVSPKAVPIASPAAGSALEAAPAVNR